MASRQRKHLGEETLRARGRVLEERALGRYPQGVAPYANLNGQQRAQRLKYATKNHRKAEDLL